MTIKMILGTLLPLSVLAMGQTTQTTIDATMRVKNLQQAFAAQSAANPQAGTLSYALADDTGYGLGSSVPSIVYVTAPPPPYAGATCNGKAVGDGNARGSVIVSDCSMTSGSPTLSCASNHFASTDVGKKILVEGSGATYGGYWAGSLSTTVSGFTDAQNVTLATKASYTIGAVFTDVTLTGVVLTGRKVTIPLGSGDGLVSGELVTVTGQTGTTDLSFLGVYNITVTGAHTSTYQQSAAYPPATTIGATIDTHAIRVAWGTDDTIAVQAVENYAASIGGARLIFPAGICFVQGISMPCAVNGVAGCTKSDNNIEISGAGMGTTTLENWNTAATGGLLAAGYSAAPSWKNTVGNDYLRNLHVHDLTLRNPWASNQQVTNTIDLRDAIFERVEAIGASMECFYDVIRSYGNVYRDNLAGPCGRYNHVSAFNLGGDHVTAYNNQIRVSSQGFEVASTYGLFHHNRIFGGLGFNVGSTNRGIWKNRIENNELHAGAGIVVQNGNGVACDNDIMNNSIEDGTISVAAGLDVNLVTPSDHPDPQPCVHGASTVQGNTVTGSLGGGIGGGGLEAVSILDNHIEVTALRCNGGTNNFLTCESNADCPGGGACGSLPSLSVIGGGGNPWAPSKAYAQYTYAEPTLPNSYSYTVTVAGTSGTIEPPWCTTLNCTVTDNGVTWTNTSLAPSSTLANNSIHFPVYTTGAEAFATGLGAIWLGGRRREVQISGLTSSAPFEINTAGGQNYDQNDGTTEPYGYPASYIPGGFVYSDQQRWWQGSGWPAYTLLPPTGEYYTRGTVVNRTDATTGAGGLGWVVTASGYAAPSWTTSQSCPFGLFVQPTTANTHIYESVNVATGMASSTQPIWSTSGGTVTDGTCSWKDLGANLAAVLTQK